MVKSYLTKNPSETKKLGEKLAKRILKEKLKKRAVIIGLAGELGGGKTTFLQGFAKGLGIKEKILSPTFVILKKFKIPNPLDAKRTPRRVAFQIPKFKHFYHIDCYRIDKPKHILDLGFKEIISFPQNIVAIEWADRIQKIMLKGTIWIKLKFINKQKRQITIKSFK